MKDKALDTIADLVGGLVGMMEHGRLPAVDFADLRTMFLRDPDGPPKIWYVGQGVASGEDRAQEAARLAASDLTWQADHDGRE